MAAASEEAAMDAIAASIEKYRRTGLPPHQRLLAVQAAMADVISQQGLPPTPTAYFAALLSALSPSPSSSSSNPKALNPNPNSTSHQRQALLTLLAVVLPKTPPAVLRAKMAAALGGVVACLEEWRALGGEREGEGEGEGEGGEGEQAGVKAGLECLQLLLCAGEKGNWLPLARGFGAILHHALDGRPKVRKLAQSSLVEVFADLRGTQAHAIASDSVVSLCENLLTAAITEQQNIEPPSQPKKTKKSAKSADPEPSRPAGVKAAVKALYMLGTLKQILPLLSTSAINRIMVRLAELAELHQPMLTRHVCDNFLALFRSTAQMAPLALADVLRRILEEGGRPGKGDTEEIRGLVQVAQLGLEKLHELDSKICAQQLPFAFHALVDHLASEQEGVVYGAAESLRSVIEKCIDEQLIQDAISQHGKAPELKGKAGPSALERICSAMERSLQYQYSTAWDMALLLMSSLFDKLGPASYLFLSNVVRTLGQLQELPDSEIRCRKQLHAAVGSAIAAMGPAQFLSILPLQMDDSELATWRVWLLPILRQHIVGSSLLFFSEKILPLAASLQERAKKAAASGRPVAAKNASACRAALWALLPAACNLPADTAASLRGLAKTMGDALTQEPPLRPIVCRALQTLILQNRAARGDPPLFKKGKGEEEEEEEFVAGGGSARERARERYTAKVAGENLAVLASFSRNFLPLLFNAFVAERPEKRAELQQVIAAYVSISDVATVKSFFVAVMQKLLEATKEQAKGREREGEGVAMDTSETSEKAAARRCTFMDLAVCMVPGLDAEARSALYVTARPALQDGDPAVQKKAYKLLARLCEADEKFVEEQAEDLLEHLLASLSVCPSSAKRHRLLALRHVIAHLLQKRESKKEEAVAALLSEIILATKEANTKTRTAAYDLLVAIPRSMEANGTPSEGLLKFFNMVVAGLAGASSHMVSASVTALSRLLYEFSFALLRTVPELLPAALLLLRSKSREVVKSVLGLAKVVVVRLPGEELEPHVPSLLEGLLLWCQDSKNHFKMKVRVILERLVRRCGYDVVARAMPEEHLKLLTHIRKTNEREQRKKRAGMSEAGEEKSTAGKSRASTARKSQWNHTDIFSDDESAGDEDEDFASTQGRSEGDIRSRKYISAASAKSMRNRKLNTRLPEDAVIGEDEPLDLLDADRTRRVLSAPVKNGSKTEDEDIETAEDGRLIIEDEGKWSRKRLRDDEEGEGGEGERRGRERGLQRKNKKRDSQEKGRTLFSERDESARKNKRIKGWAYTGEEYAASKGKVAKGGRGGGDTKLEGKLEPHAYWPLDPKMLNRREGKRAAARKGMASVLKTKGGKKGEGSGIRERLKARVGGVRKGQKSHKGQGKSKVGKR